MTLLLVRHGRTVANASGELLGRRDPPLDDVGEAQAAATASQLRARVASFDLAPVRVVASPLLRAARTAAVIADQFDVAVEADERWIELDYGELDGVGVADVSSATWEQWRRDPTFAPPGGETMASLRARVDGAFAEALASAAEGTTVIVVSHVSPIKAAVTIALGVGDEVAWRLFLSPASITELWHRSGGAVLVGFNDTSHL